MDIDIVVGLSIHVDIHVHIHGLVLIELCEAQFTEQCSLSTFQFGGRHMELHLCDSTDTGSGAVHPLTLVDAGGVSVKCYRQPLGLVVHFRRSFIGYRLEEGIIVAAIQSRAESAEGIGSIALHRTHCGRCSKTPEWCHHSWPYPAHR